MRGQGLYPDSGVNTYATSHMHNMSGQPVEHKSDPFQGRLEAFTPEREPYGASKQEGQWRWERDETKVTNHMGPQQYNEGKRYAYAFHNGHVGNAARSYFQGQRADPKSVVEKGISNDPRSQARCETIEIAYGENLPWQNFDGLEQKFLDDIMKLAKEQNDAEDIENARHREKINAINIQYGKQLSVLRSRHTNRRDELLRMESRARRVQYQKSVMDSYSNGSMGPSDPHGYDGVPASASVGEPRQSYDSGRMESYGERGRYVGGGARDPGFEPRGPYPGGRAYDGGSRFY